MKTYVKEGLIVPIGDIKSVLVQNNILGEIISVGYPDTSLYRYTVQVIGNNYDLPSRYFFVDLKEKRALPVKRHLKTK